MERWGNSYVFEENYEVMKPLPASPQNDVMGSNSHNFQLKEIWTRGIN